MPSGSFSSRGYLYPSVVRLVGAGVVVRRLPIPRVTGHYCRPAGRSRTRSAAVDYRLTTGGPLPGWRGRASTTVVVVTRGGDDVRDGDGDEDEDGGADRDEDDDYDDSNYNDDDDDDAVGDMCGCATSTRRGLGTAAGKSARRAKSSCSVHRTPGIR